LILLISTTRTEKGARLLASLDKHQSINLGQQPLYLADTCGSWRVVKVGTRVEKGPGDTATSKGSNVPDNIANMIYVVSVVSRKDACYTPRKWLQAVRPCRPHQGLWGGN
jgi:hypothetical protein